jgi:hypothetical protein
MGGTLRTHGFDGKCIGGRKTGREVSTWTTKLGWVGIITVNLKEIGWVNVDLIWLRLASSGRFLLFLRN